MNCTRMSNIDRARYSLRWTIAIVAAIVCGCGGKETPTSKRTAPVEERSPEKPASPPRLTIGEEATALLLEAKKQPIIEISATDLCEECRHPLVFEKQFKNRLLRVTGRIHFVSSQPNVLFRGDKVVRPYMVWLRGVDEAGESVLAFLSPEGIKGTWVWNDLHTGGNYYAGAPGQSVVVEGVLVGGGQRPQLIGCTVEPYERRDTKPYWEDPAVVEQPVLPIE